jgi:hypothetical protein
MQTIRRLFKFQLHLSAFVLLAATVAEGRAGPISGSGGLEGLGTFSGSMNYMAIDAGHATLTIELSNTSAATNGGYLTAFAFHNPSDRITGAVLTSTNTNFGLLGGPNFLDTIKASPFGNFDLGASTSNQFLGGGSPLGGIGVGESSTFAFALTGNGLDELTIESFIAAAATGTDRRPTPVAFLARFRGFNDGGSDKVPGFLTIVPEPGNIPETPEPATLTLGVLAALAVFGRRCRGQITRRRT